MMKMESYLKELEKQFAEAESKLSSPEVTSNPESLKQVAKRHSELGKIMEAYGRYKQTFTKLEEAKALQNDPDMEIASLAAAEVESTGAELEKRKRELQILLLPKDPNDEKDILLEIRAGTGGEEAALFAADLFRAYARYAERRNWRIEIISQHETGHGGFKEIIFSILGENIYRQMKFESGTHRVQRVPETEASGRIHTSAVTVAVLPEAEEVEVEIEPDDLRIDVFRSTGPGGQSVNTTDSAVRITHIPSGLVVTCQDEKSQHKNKARALKVLRARLLDRKIQRQQAEISASRRLQVGTGDRSERIRTYNFPQNRVTDHRIGLTLYKLNQIIEGDLDELIQALVLEDHMGRLRNLQSELDISRAK